MIIFMKKNMHAQPVIVGEQSEREFVEVRLNISVKHVGNGFRSIEFVKYVLIDN